MSRSVNYRKQDTNLFAGTEIKLRFTVVDDDASGAAVDITGWTFQYDQNDNEKNPTTGNVIQKTSGSGIVITDAVNGELEVTLDPSDTSDAAFKTEHKHYWSLVRLTPTPITMLGEGRIFVKGTPFQSETGSGGGGGSFSAWTAVVRGIVANDSSELSVYQTAIGRQYILATYISPDGVGNQFTSGDEDNPTLRAVSSVAASTVIDDTLSGDESIGPIIEPVSFAGSTPIAAVGVGSGGLSDNLSLRINDDGSVDATHTAPGGGDGTNGVYVLWEKG